jgi:hypothetical protein
MKFEAMDAHTCEMGAKLAPVQKCGNYGYQNMYFIFYI